MRQRKNQGFTLVELIVASAIMGIVALASAGFLSAGARTYRSVNYSLRLQYESQLTMAQLQEYLIDCNGRYVRLKNPISGGTNSISTSISADAPSDASVGTLHCFRYSHTDQTLYYGENRPRSAVGPSADDLLSEHISAMSVNLDAVNSSVTVELTFTRQNKSYTSAQTLSLRNRPAVSSSLSDLLDLIYPVP